MLKANNLHELNSEIAEEVNLPIDDVSRTLGYLYRKMKDPTDCSAIVALVERAQLDAPKIEYDTEVVVFSPSEEVSVQVDGDWFDATYIEKTPDGHGVMIDDTDEYMTVEDTNIKKK